MLSITTRVGVLALCGALGGSSVGRAAGAVPVLVGAIFACASRARRLAGLAVAGSFAFATLAHGATVTFDVAGHATINTAAGLVPPPGYFITTLSAPSSVTVEIADDGSVMLTGATLTWEMFSDFLSAGTVTTNEVLMLPAGGLGALVGDQIVWSSEPVFGSLEGTFSCVGIVCSTIGVPPDTILPLSAMGPVPSFAPVTEGIDLGTWLLSDDHSQIVGSTRMVTALFYTGDPSRWLVLGDTDLSVVPEPGAIALLLVGAVGAITIRFTS